jgi:two-component sensor histidine kinase/ligand-binding sensor domain-containing protein
MGKFIVQWFIVLICLPSCNGLAQSTVLYFNEPPKEALSRNRSQLLVSQFFSDRDDFLWFISNGLHRYDGHEIASIRSNPVDLNSLSSASVVDMIQDDKGNFWITTRDGGLNAYNPHTGKVAQFHHVPTNSASLSTDKLRFLQRDESGKIWIASDWGMNYFDPKTGQTVRFLPAPGQPGQLQGNPLSPIIVDGRNRIYVSTTVGFEYYDRNSKQWHCFPTLDRNGVPVPNFIVGLNATNSLCKDRTGIIWMGIPNQTGLSVFNPKSGQIAKFDKLTMDGKPIPYPNVILEDRSGRLWLCCKNDIFRISADRTVVEQCTAVAVENQEQLSELQLIYEDRQGLIWLVRHGDKNPLFFDARQERYPNLQMPKLGKLNPLASHILHDSTDRAGSGLIWISSDLGLIRHDPGRSDTKFVLTGINITSVSLLSGHYLLVISADDGLFIFDKTTHRSTPVRLNKTGGSIQAPIFSVLDKDGDLWVSTWGYGLFSIPKGQLYLETGVVHVYDQWKNDPADSNSLASNLLQKIAVDVQNNVWVCGGSNGLCRVSKRDRRVQRFMLKQGDPDGIAGNNTYAPLVDKQGDVWVMSGRNNPLQRLSVKTGRFKKYGIADGFTDEYFAHATLDETGKIWFNQNHVVSCIDPVTEKVNTFPQFVGTSAYATPIAARFGTGEVYFSCQNNLRRFTPASVASAPRTPSPLRLVSVSSFDADGTIKALPEDRWRNKELALSYKENTLKIKFALLDYRNTTSREYAYALTATNEEPQWVNIGLNNVVDFAQLTPGSYLFHLKARNSDGIWTKLAAPLLININPPWWLSPIAHAFYALLLLLGFGLLMKVRLREQARELALKEAVVIRQQRDEIGRKNSQNEVLLKEVHHRVKNNLGVVSGLLSLQSAKITDPKVLEAIQASQNRVQSMSIIHQKLYQGEQLGAIEMRDYFGKLSESILHSFDMADKVHIDCLMPELLLDIDTAISVGLITNELLTNSLKYAFVGKDSGTIHISLIRRGDDSLLLQVADNGIGKKPLEKDKETGFGSELVELLTRQLDGVLTYENQDGTLVKLRFNRPAIA